MLVLALGSLGSCASASRPAPDALPATAAGGSGAEDTHRYAVALTREAVEVRVRRGLTAMERSRCLTLAAVARAEEIGAGPLEHRPLPDVSRRCTASGRVAENLARSAAAPAEVFAAWMESAGHRNNLVDPALARVGTACTSVGGEVLCVQLYAEAE